MEGIFVPVRLSEQKWQEVLAGWPVARSSGQSQVEYARQHGITDRALRMRMARLGAKPSGPRANGPREQLGLLLTRLDEVAERLERVLGVARMAPRERTSEQEAQQAGIPAPTMAATPAPPASAVLAGEPAKPTVKEKKRGIFSDWEE